MQNPNQTTTTRNAKHYPQGKFWLLTIPHAQFTPWLPPSVCFSKGQLELGEGGYLHWQVVVCFQTKVRLATVKEVYGSQAHCELSRSDAANKYVWKDETQVAGTQFELGELPFRRNNPTDWERVKKAAQAGRLEEIDANVYVQNYSSLKRIALDNMAPLPGTREVVVYWGPTGTGKSHRAWSEATMGAYPKPPTTKWWDGYQPEKHSNVVMDEFDGQIGITHLLRWFDKYPCVVEQKGGGCCLIAKKIWITSNIDPDLWYPDGKPAQVQALKRRLKIVKMETKYVEPPTGGIVDIPDNDNALFQWLNADRYGPHMEGCASISSTRKCDCPLWN